MSLKQVDIRGHKSLNSGGTQCRGFVVLESRCCVFLVLECWYRSFLSSEKMPWFFSPWILMWWYFGLGILMSWFFGLGILMLWYIGVVVGICAPTTMFSLSSWKQKNHTNISNVQIYATSICITYAQAN